jgi:hypothetical protein
MNTFSRWPIAVGRLRAARTIDQRLRFFAAVVYTAILGVPTFHGLAQQTFKVELLPGDCSDISVGADGTAWRIAFDSSTKNRHIYRWTGSLWMQADGEGTRIAVDPQGNAWVLESDGDVKHWENGRWSDKPGRGTDIAVGANGDVWMVGWYRDLFDTDHDPNNREIFRWTGSDWVEVDGDAVRIAVAPDGTPWIINKDGGIRQRIGVLWREIIGSAMDFAIGPDGSMWASLADDWDGDGILARWEGTKWVIQGNSSAPVTVDPAGLPWFADDDGNLFRAVANPELRLSMPIVSDGKVEFSFPTVSGANYVVQVWRDLRQPWTELQSVVGNGSPVTVTDTPPPGTATSFYAVSQK